MTTFNYNKEYIMKDGKPWFPIMGEMHYSRYPKKYWDESLQKIKAGRLDVVSSYVIWIHHEEEEGVFDFTGNKDLRGFIEACERNGIYMFLRIGPWAHGEVRNGGFPDWLLKKDFEVRTNDEGYFKTVEKFYRAIYKQVEGHFVKDGGAIIGVQIENEYGHCGGLNGEEGERHMVRLWEMAKEIGFDVPLYTATGWGGAVTGGLLPVMGGYCEAPWDQRLTEIEPSGNYIFTRERNDHNIGSDYGFGHGITFDIETFPYLTAELGGGLQVTHHRRPIAKAKDIGGMTLAKLGSGVNLLGYYMYHGGTNPYGKFSTLQESRATGYLNDLPELSYDFRAPIREYGQMTDTLNELKIFAMFAEDFGEELCKMPVYIPQDNPDKPTNQTDLRNSVRHNGKEGYVFINNFQRRQEMAAHKGVELKVELENETITFPPLDVEDGDYAFYPFNMKLDGIEIKSCLMTPLCKVNGTYVFYGERKETLPEADNILKITREMALSSWKISLDQEYLVISENPVIANLQGGYDILAQRDMEVRIYPELAHAPEGFEKVGTEGAFTIYRKKLERSHAGVSFEQQENGKYKVVLSGLDKKANNYLVDISYIGDVAKAYLPEQESAFADNFYTGESWQIGLRGFDFPTEFLVAIAPLHKGDQIYLEEWPEMQDGSACQLKELTLIEEHRVKFL